jgi:mannose-6-phosphate isomerase
MTDVILPSWMERGWDSDHGGFHERQDEVGEPIDLGYKRLTSTARQLFVLSEWSRCWNEDGCSGLAHQTYDYLMNRFWDHGSEGWISKVTTQGLPSDRTHDLYAHAFVIFALARYGKIYSNRTAIETAQKTMAILNERMRHPVSGYVSMTDRDWNPMSYDIDQNPHMHLFEALQILNDVERNDLTSSCEADIAEMMGSLLYDNEFGVLREHFDQQGKPHHENGWMVEPGHQFEWYWLARGGPDKTCQATLAPLVQRMFDWGLKHGLDRAHGGIYDRCHIEGRVDLTTKRIWPTTEFIRASACRWKIEKDPLALTHMNQQLEILLKHFLAPVGWYEILDEELHPLRRDMPATTCYHLTTCCIDSLSILDEATA